MSKPTFILVPGAWHGPEIYSTVMNKLNEHGYPTIALPLPSNGADPPHQTFDEDVKAIRDTLTKVVDTEEKEVVLVLHSYAGVPGAEATKDLSKNERHAKDLEGGVVRLVFIAALAMPEGLDLPEGLNPPGAGGKMPKWMKLDFEKGIVTVDPEDAKNIFYMDLSPDEQDKWASKLTHQSLGVYSSKQTYAAWLHIPSIYVGGAQDKTMLIPDIEEKFMEKWQGMKAGACDEIQVHRGGHCLMISQPQWLFEVLREGATEHNPVEVL